MKRLLLWLFKILKVQIIINDFKNVFSTPELIYQQMDYDKYWENRELENTFQYRWPLMSSEIKSNSSILDIGCGDGGFLVYLKNKKENISETGIDISSIGVNRAKNKGINSFVASLDLYDGQYGLFDIVTISEVIEHVSNSEYFVKRGFELAREKFIITIPNTGYYTYRIRLLFGRFPVQWVHHPGEHLRFWTIRDFRIWLKSLEMGTIRKCRIIPSNEFPFFYLYKLLPSMFSRQIVIVIEK